jgi:hypothetical protein
MTTFVKWELYLISSMMHILSIKVNKITVSAKLVIFTPECVALVSNA